MADDKATPISTTETDEIDEQKLEKVAGGAKIAMPSEPLTPLPSLAASMAVEPLDVATVFVPAAAPKP